MYLNYLGVPSTIDFNLYNLLASQLLELPLLLPVVVVILIYPICDFIH